MHKAASMKLANVACTKQYNPRMEKLYFVSGVNATSLTPKRLIYGCHPNAHPGIFAAQALTVFAIQATFRVNKTKIHPQGLNS